MYGCHGKQTRVQLSKLLTGITHDVVKIHARQPPVAFLDVHLEVLITDSADDTTVDNSITQQVLIRVVRVVEESDDSIGIAALHLTYNRNMRSRIH